jgi:diaminohydroxyphosphoribosylaminopyrimidine deaminase / 5-amino-6-(5-phosphoribosylamino)uracil reductase
MEDHQLYMQRCIELAQLGAFHTMSNPKVGAVLVYRGNIIGEGYHKTFGKEHAEVNCINSVKQENKQYISQATLYVSLEPCNHFGKTPPCTHLIVEKGIKTVVIGTQDNYNEVDGAGIAFLKNNGVAVIHPCLEKECRELNETFFYFNHYKRPFITLKWAESEDGFINLPHHKRTLISNEMTSRYVHQLRGLHQAILVGSGTFLTDQPQLNNRYFGMKQPVKIIIDRYLKIPLEKLKKAGNDEMIVINYVENKVDDFIRFIKVDATNHLLDELMIVLGSLNIQSLLVEGGATIHQLFMEKNLFNKMIQIKNESLYLHEGIKSPQIPSLPLQDTFHLGSDVVKLYAR